MIVSFARRDVEKLYELGTSRKWHRDISDRAIRVMVMIDAAHSLADLAAVPGLRLEKLLGQRAETWSVRVNRQWRIVFRWSHEGAQEVDLIDYHR